MYPWVILIFVTAAAVLGLDYLVRRKKWKDNSREEKISLLIHMFSVGPHVFLSALGMLWGIVAASAKTAFGKVLFGATLLMGQYYFLVAIAAVVLSFVFRKNGKVKASIWTNVITLLYITIVLTVNYLAGKIL